jgi:TonB family protein
MGYQALLFCPDEKTARTVTQVLTELEFAVEPCTEAFAAVKKLMAGHFDAVVVDCDNEQNAALLFKSAKNSTAGQASLAVAVVEGQSGVAKAFRIGANLVLTKPINVEQAKGTLRVARGLLRKGDPGKATAPMAPTSPVAPAPTTPTISAKAVPPLGSTAPQRPIAAPPIAKLPVPPANLAQAASAKASIPAPVAKIPEPAEADVIEIDVDDEAMTAAAPAPFKPIPAFSQPAASDLHVPAVAHSGSTGAASAPAPARIAPEIKADPVAPAVPLTPAFDQDIGHAEGSAPAPSFTFGGANVPAESSGSSKKIFIGVAAAVLIAGGLYFAWTQINSKSSSSAPAVQQNTPVNPVSSENSSKIQSSPIAAATKPSSTVNSSPTAQPTSATTTDETQAGSDKGALLTKSGAKGLKPSSIANKPAAETSGETEEEPAAQPIMVKNGSKSPATGKAAPVADVPDPNVMASAAGSGSGLLNLVTSANGPKPILQTLNVSQGVSQGLLIKKVQPNYPSTALHMRVEGAVQLMATIGKTGNITAVKVVSGEPLLAQAAQEAVKQWKYKPYFLNGEPVEIQTQVTVNFKLPR